MKKPLITIIILAVVLIGGYVAYDQLSEQKTTTESNVIINTDTGNTEESLRAIIETRYTEFKDYENQESFAGHAVNVAFDGDDFYAAYLELGSGMPIVMASCFRVDSQKNVYSLGIYPNPSDSIATYEDFDPTTCSDIDNVSNNINSSDIVQEDYDGPISSHDIIFLHHSTGGNIWDGGVSDWFDEYNADNDTAYAITDQEFPKDSPYGWENYPYDYWNIWVNHAGHSRYQDEPTLEILTQQYDTIVWKHCFPVSDIEADSGSPSVSSSDKTIANYKLQYAALKSKMLEFPDTNFIVWTGAAQVQGATTAEYAGRAQTFFSWVVDTWDEPGDNIFIWDLYNLETEGGLYLKSSYAESPDDSHPDYSFSSTVAPLFSQRVVDVIEGNGDSGSVTGE